MRYGGSRLPQMLLLVLLGLLHIYWMPCKNAQLERWHIALKWDMALLGVTRTTATAQLFLTAPVGWPRHSRCA